MDYYITEASTEKRFKCPYCELRLARGKLIDHIDKVHEDMIPDGYSSTRLVFNLINKKDHGNCVICKQITPWNESLSRYERYCIDNNGRCKDKAAKLAKENMKKKYGKEHLLDDDEHQKMMLSNRSISGTYKFSTGGSATYTGSYERKLLEFLDKVMGYRAIDLFTPGPTIEYTYKNKTHSWITDLYLIPYNLVFDVKDGGDNPNNRRMEEYRAKQTAKENAIIKQGKYNYIRLTDNNFVQLMNILAELKAELMDSNSKTDKPIIRIHENCPIFIDEDCSSLVGNKNQYSSIEEYSNAVLGAMVGSSSEIYIIPYMYKNSFNVEYGISDNLTLDSIFTTDDNGDIKVKNNKFLKEECEVYSVFRFINPTGNKISNPNNLAEVITGKKILDPSQLIYDEDFERVLSFDDMLKIAQESITESLKSTEYEIPFMSGKCEDNNILHYTDRSGIFIKNESTGLRSKSYDNINNIPKEVYKFISEGIL